MRRFFQLSLSLLMFFQIQSVFASDTLHAFYFNGESEFIRRFNASLVSFARTRHADIKQYDAKNSASLQLNQVYSTISSKDPLMQN